MARTKKPATEGLNGALAQTIRGELAARGITREQLAASSGVPLDSLKNYLSPSPTRARVMDVEVVGQIAGGLGFTPAQLMSLAEQRMVRERWEADHLYPSREAADEQENLVILDVNENRTGAPLSIPDPEREEELLGQWARDMAALIEGVRAGRVTLDDIDAGPLARYTPQTRRYMLDALKDAAAVYSRERASS